MSRRLRYLLLQVRNDDDPMRAHEVHCFAEELSTDPARIEVVDLLHAPPSWRHIDAADVVLIGGSGDYSVATGGPWLDPALEVMREICQHAKPMFASCWGFQAIAAALGGRVVHDLDRAELGTINLELTEAGHEDELFAPLGSPFPAQLGHEDIVDTLPPEAILLASSDRVTNEAFKIDGAPIYATQFHPELDRAALLTRLREYPKYIEKISGRPFDEFQRSVMETPGTSSLMSRFVQLVLAHKV